MRLFILALWFSSFSGYSQTLTVLDKTTLHPLEGVSIKNSNINSIIYTNAKGEASFSSRGLTDTIRIERLGYYPLLIFGSDINEKQNTIFLNQKSFELNEVVISISKFQEKRTMVPQQIQVLKSKDIEYMNPQNTADLVQQTGNVMVQKSQLGGGSPIIRGFEANKVLLVLDGVRMNNAIFRGGHLQNILSIDNTILDRAEIVFGPGSTVYGSDALGGVIHFYTKNPILSDDKVRIHSNAFMRYSSSANERSGHIDVNIGFKKVGFLSSITYSDFDDLRQGNIRNKNHGEWGKRTYYYQRINNQDSSVLNKDVNIQKFSGYQQIDFLQKVLFRQNKKINHILNLQYSTTSNVPRYDRLTEMTSPDKLKFAEWYYGPQNRLLASYNLNFTSPTLYYDHLKVIAAYQNIQESRNDRRFGNDILRHREEKVDVATLNIDLKKTAGKNEVSYGAEYAFNYVNSRAYSKDIVTQEISSLDTRYPDGGSTYRTLAAYLSHSLKIHPKLILTDGLRYSHIDLHSRFQDTTFFKFPFDKVSQKSGAWNGNIGLVFKPNRSTQVTLIGSSGFRAPNVDDMSKVFESIPGRVIVPNPDLKPEYTYNGEIGFVKMFFDKVQLGSTFYYTIYDDAITTQSFKYLGKDTIEYEGKTSRVTANVNATEAFLYGYNISFSADLTSVFTVSSTFNYTYGRIKTDSTHYPLDHIPPFFGKTSFFVNVKKLRSEFFIQYNGWKKLKNYNLVGEDNIQYATPSGTPSWYTLNIRLAYQLNSFLQLQTSIENILDKNYRVFGSGISASGRNLSLTLRSRL